MSIDEVLVRMTLEEKVALLAGDGLWTVPGVPRLGIRPLKVSDGPAGVRGNRVLPSTCFPSPSLLGATWDPALVERIGAALAQEAVDKGVQVLLAPTINLQRTALGGRNFECFSEDPWLTARLAAAYVRGLQPRGIGACLKHYVANDQEFERHTVSVEVDERTLREVYLHPFLQAIAEAKPWSVMAAYNRLNGTYCTEHPWLLTHILREELDYDGVVMSDWTATHSTVEALVAGLDLEMPGPPQWRGQKLLEAVRSGQVNEETIDRSVRRMLLLYQRTGRFEEGPPIVEEQAIDRPEHRALIREAAAAGMVLLANDGVLPLDLSQYRRVAIIGPHASRPAPVGGGSAFVRPHRVVSPVEALREAAPALELLVEPGVAIYRQVPPLEGEMLGSTGAELAFFGNAELSGEPVVRLPVTSTDLLFLGDMVPGVDPANVSARLRLTLKVPESGHYTFGASALGQIRVLLDGQLIVDNWTNPQRGRSFFGFGSEEVRATVELQAGRSYELVAEYRKAMPGLPVMGLRVGMAHELPEAERMERAVRAAQEADLALVFVGLTPEWESEGFDRESFDLPGAQNELVEAVAKANPNTVVVVTAGSPVHLPWLGRVRALLWAWYAGEEVGHALWDVLTGVREPGGRLPMTYPRRLEDTPAFLHHPGEFGRLRYCEGIFVGYRWYDARAVEPLFPFGFGLSYTRFDYRDLELDRAVLGAGEQLAVSCTVENVGERPGSDVVQLYIGFPSGPIRRPPKELRDFARVRLQPGETQRVRFSLRPQDLAYYDEVAGRWIAPAGSYRVLVGPNAQDLRLMGSFEVRETMAWEPGERYRVETPSGTSNA